MSNKKRKFLSGITMFLMVLSSFPFLGITNVAQAALTAVGPVLDPVNNGYPQYFSDENGLALQLCLDQTTTAAGTALCVLTPEYDPDPTITPGVPAIPIGTVASGNFPDESFYAIADGRIIPGIRLPGANTDLRINYRAALEQAFLGGIVPGTQAIFLRVQADLNGLVPNTTYTIDHPFGTMSVTTDATGGGRGRLEDLVQCNAGVPCNFAPILPATNTQVGSFLQWDNVLPAPPAGFIGDPNVEHTVSGGRGGFNQVVITGPDAGGLGVNTISTNLFTVAGKLADTIPPVITLNGANPLSVTAGTAYVEPGATANDNFDGVIPPVNIQIASTVPAGNLVLGAGPFTVTYSVSDRAGNTATLVRTVSVVPDIVSPIITINGNNPAFVLVNGNYTDAGASALDNVDGAISVTTTFADPLAAPELAVNTAVAGAHAVTYTATDSSNNTATAVRTVNVTVDSTAPVITITGGAVSNVTAGTAYIEQGATSLDDFDGILPVVVSASTVPAGNLVIGTGPFTVSYSVTDLSNNTATAQRTVNIVADVIAPVITLNGASPMSVEAGSAFADPSATALDNVDGAVVVSAVSTVPAGPLALGSGPFTVTYTATDSSNNIATLVRTVNVVADATPPAIAITGANPATILINTSYTDAGATATDNIDAVVNVVATGLPLDTATAGPKTVTYTATDSSGNIATATRTVNVVTDAVPPVIRMLGDNPVQISQNAHFNDSAVTASDDQDGDITSRVVISGLPIDTSVASTQTITYTVADLAGNTTVATRTIIIGGGTPAPAPAPSSGGGGGGGGGGAPAPASAPGGQVLGATAFPVGALIKSANEPEVFLMSADGTKRHIASAEVFNANGFNWNNIQVVDQAALNAIPKGVSIEAPQGGAPASSPASQGGQVLGQAAVSNGMLVKQADEPEVFFIENGVRRHVDNPQVFVARGFNWANVKTIDKAALEAISRGASLSGASEGEVKGQGVSGKRLIRQANDFRVFEIDDQGNKHWLNMSADEFIRSGRRFESVEAVDAAEIGRHGTGDDISSGGGTGGAGSTISY